MRPPLNKQVVFAKYFKSAFIRSIRGECFRGELFSAFVAGDHAVFDVDDPISMLGNIGFVGDQNNRIALAVQVFHEFHNFIAGLRIQVAGRLVGQDDGWIIDQGAGNGDALALSAGKLIGLVVHAFAQIDGGKRGLGALNAFVRGRAAIDQGQLHVVQSRGAREQIERLKYEADFFIADAREFVVIEFADQIAVEPVTALGRRVEAADQVHERGLAGARGTHDGNIFAAIDAQVHSAQRVHLLCSHLVGFPEILSADDAALRWCDHPFRNIRDLRCHAFLLLCCHQRTPLFL